MLTNKDITHFKEKGYVVLPNFIDHEQISEWNDQFWSHISANPEKPTTWPDSYVIDEFSTDPIFGHLPQMEEVVTRLGGGNFSGGGGSMLVQ